MMRQHANVNIEKLNENITYENNVKRKVLTTRDSEDDDSEDDDSEDDDSEDEDDDNEDDDDEMDTDSKKQCLLDPTRLPVR